MKFVANSSVAREARLQQRLRGAQWVPAMPHCEQITDRIQ